MEETQEQQQTQQNNEATPAPSTPAPSSESTQGGASTGAGEGAPRSSTGPRPGGPPRTGGGPRPGGGGPRPGGGPRGGPRGGRRGGRPRYYARRKVCSFCVDKVQNIEYRDVEKFRRFVSDRYKIEARRKTGVCAKHQRALSRAIKRARHLGLMPFTPDQRQRSSGWSM